ncbi:uncharacterized protein LOC18441100 isoform X2 [Amborella trichopoda]|uniref:C2H2-type domain-containing protein n=1 Tax=Amborella trichopoda TaxID=13333 RepID=W1PXW5_AMBTC|nr:uncharacterized protein LOC18441100 isoform X2 [Amborella trichopoda]ERN12864.1 hypothetical protein AMTR_s00050p00062960 [Amborella trichopoda]|eukprot:XP_006851283.1 uncharacterized protein LOC18441100 isoform X2 [Amborella trichopoda]
MGVAKAVSIALLFPLFLHSTLTSSSSTINYNNNQDIQVSAAARQLQQYEPNHEVHCSRERSRAAWKIIEEYLMPFVEQEKYQISHKCRLHPSNDMFREQEQHKTQVDVNEWRCGFCQKMFHAENYLDTHFQNRHQNLLNDTHDRCLADLCGALHCDLVDESKQRKTKCNPAAAAKNRHLCQSLADTCFPVNEGHSTSRLHEFFLRQFCDAHSCSGRHKPFARGGRKRSSVFYLAISILTLMLLPIFYGIVYLYRREMRSGVHDLKRISQTGIGRKTKPT